MFLFYCLIFALGTSYGSFLGLVAYREQKSISIIAPRSYCDSCQTALSALALIPIIGFFLMKGECKSCHSKISIHSMLLELTIGILTVLFVFLTFSLQLFAILFLMLFLSAEDLATKSINPIPILVAQLVILIDKPTISSLLLLLFSAALIFFEMPLLNAITNKIGEGDLILILLFFQLGSVILATQVIFLACCIVLIFYPWLKNRFPIPFVPFLSAGLIIILLIQKSV